jgi:hypothetical protein
LDMPMNSDAKVSAKPKIAACAAGSIWKPQMFMDP